MKSSAEKTWMAVLSAIIILFTFFNAYQMMATQGMTQEQSNIANLLLGYTFGLSNLVAGYYYASSVSSRDKTQYINSLLEDSRAGRYENWKKDEEASTKNEDLEEDEKDFLLEKKFHG